jgi:hypothetical protein
VSSFLCARRTFLVLLLASFGPSLRSQTAQPSSSFRMASFAALRAYGPSDALAVGDFNRDGTPDVAMGSYSPNPYQSPTTTASIWRGEGNGHLRLAETYTVGPNPSPIVVGDFNGDGKLDLAMGTYDFTTSIGNISVLLGNGDGTFRPPVVTALRLNVSAYGLTAVDLNGDGKLDLALP